MTKTVMVLSVGTVNILSGKTQYEWGIYDDGWKNNMFAWLASGCLLFSSNETDFEIGETVTLRNNDSSRKIKECTIKDKSIVNETDLMEMLKSNGYDYTPLRPFKKRPQGNQKLTTSYSVKGEWLKF